MDYDKLYSYKIYLPVSAFRHSNNTPINKIKKLI